MKQAEPLGSLPDSGSPKKPFFSCLGCFLAGGALLTLTAILLPGWGRPRPHKLMDCKTNLATLGTAVELYASDTHGQPPADLGHLLPGYLKELPTCPAATSMSYRYELQGKNYTIWCEGHNHDDAYGREVSNFPQYVSSLGVIHGPPP